MRKSSLAELPMAIVPPDAVICPEGCYKRVISMYVPKGDPRGRKNKYHIDREKFVFACNAVVNDEMKQVDAAEYCGLPINVFRSWIFRYFEPGIYGELPEDAFINYGLPRLGTKDGF